MGIRVNASVKVTAGARAVVGLAAALAEENRVGINFDGGFTGKQPDRKMVTMTRIAEKLRRAILIPLDKRSSRSSRDWPERWVADDIVVFLFGGLVLLGVGGRIL